MSSVRKQVSEPAPVFVSFITTPAQPQALPTRPPPDKVLVPRRKASTRLLSTPAPSTAVAATRLDPSPPAATPPPPVPSEATVASPAPGPPAPVVPPNFIAAYLDNPAPVYPPLSRRLRESGEVLLRVHVGADGHGDAFEISQGSGYERLDQAALEAVRRWRFVPARQAQQPLAAWVLIPINFQLDQ